MSRSPRPLRILLADLLHPTNQHKTFPYAAGCIGEHTRAVFGDRVDVEVFRTPEDLARAFDPTIVSVLGFSNYLWNLELSYEVIRQARAQAPRAIVVMGGPNYPTDEEGQREFLHAYDLVDFCVVKEGEQPFVQLLENLFELDFDAAGLKHQRRSLPGVHYRVGADCILPSPDLRQRDLDEFPSAYLGGLLDKFFARRDLVPLVQTKRGCPFQCTFCVEGENYYSKVGAVTTDRFRRELEYIAQRAGDGPPVLHIADSNFGMYAHDLEICDAIADIRHRYGWPETIEVSTGKNRKERVLEAVKRTNGAMRFGPALQTTDPQTLKNVKRSNISESVLMEMAGAATDLDQRSYTELILNLPGDTFESHLASIRASMDAGMQRIKMYPLILLPGTEMATPASRREFGIETRFRVLPLCHGTYRFTGDEFPSVEISELVIATNSMSFVDYLRCKRFELSVEIFYNDLYFPEIHGLARALSLSMFDFVQSCHAQFEAFPAEVRAIYTALEQGVCDNLFDTREACRAHYRNPAHLAQYARDEYKNSLGTLKALALVDHVDALLEIARTAMWNCIERAGLASVASSEYLDDLIEYSRLRRRSIMDSGVEPEGMFRFAFDEIMQREFRVDPQQFRLTNPRRMRFWHDERQVHGIRRLCAEISNPIVRARSFIYPPTDPGVNPFLRRSSFC